MNQNGGKRSAAWQPTYGDNDDRHICKKGGKGRNLAAAAMRISEGQSSQGITAHRVRQQDVSQDWREGKKMG